MFSGKLRTTNPEDPKQTSYHRIYIKQGIFEDIKEIKKDIFTMGIIHGCVEYSSARVLENSSVRVRWIISG